MNILISGTLSRDGLPLVSFGSNNPVDLGFGMSGAIMYTYTVHLFFEIEVPSVDILLLGGIDKCSPFYGRSSLPFPSP